MCVGLRGLSGARPVAVSEPPWEHDYVRQWG